MRTRGAIDKIELIHLQRPKTNREFKNTDNDTIIIHLLSICNL